MSRTMPARAAISAWRRSPSPRPTATPSWWRARASWSIRASTPRSLRPVQGFRAGHARRRLAQCSGGQSRFPAKTVKELVDLIKANPRSTAIAMPGTGTTPHLAGELFKLTFKLDLATVPFNGAGPAIQSAVGGHTPIAFTALPPAAPQVQDGKLRGLAVTSAQALGGAARCADHGGSRRHGPGIRYDAGHLGAGRHAERDRRSAQSRDRQGDGAARREGECAQLGFVPVANKPEEFAACIKVEIEQVGQGDQGREDPADPMSGHRPA